MSERMSDTMMPNDDAERLGIAELIQDWHEWSHQEKYGESGYMMERVFEGCANELEAAWLHEQQRMASVAARAEAGAELAEALKGCTGALIGASEALLAHGYVATADTLRKYIAGAEQALRKWEGAADE